MQFGSPGGLWQQFPTNFVSWVIFPSSDTTIRDGQSHAVASITFCVSVQFTCCLFFWRWNDQLRHSTSPVLPFPTRLIRDGLGDTIRQMEGLSNRDTAITGSLAEPVGNPHGSRSFSVNHDASIGNNKW